jgi:pantothenate kinase
METLEVQCATMINLIDQLYIGGQRLMIGIAGPPGSGKSTLAAAVVEQLNTRLGGSNQAALLPMDGFHLDNDILEMRGMLDRKGAPETFDVEGLLALLECVKTASSDIRYPLFDRTNDCVLTDAGLLKVTSSIIVVEGNYLLLDAPLWSEVTALFDATVFLSPLVSTLEKRLMERWISYGFSLQQASEKARGNDLINAELVLKQSVLPNLNLVESAAVTPESTNKD